MIRTVRRILDRIAGTIGAAIFLWLWTQSKRRPPE